MSAPAAWGTAPDACVGLTFEEGIATIRFNRPERLNAIDLEMARAFQHCVQVTTSRPDVRVIVLSGQGRAFVAGGDLGYFRDAGAQAPEAARTLIAPMHDAMARLAAANQPVLAVVQGAVAGAGMSLAMMADLVLAADDAVFNTAYLKVGNSPDCGLTWSLPRTVGLRKALELTLLTPSLTAAEALELGLVNRVVPSERLAAEAQNMALRLSAQAPLAVSASKRLLRSSLQHSLAEQLDAEALGFSTNAATSDFREALAAFFEKRQPRFAGL